MVGSGGHEQKSMGSTAFGAGEPNLARPTVPQFMADRRGSNGATAKPSLGDRLPSVIQVVQARAARLADTVALFQALGGCWWNRVAPPTEKVLNVGTGEAAIVLEKPDGL